MKAEAIDLVVEAKLTELVGIDRLMAQDHEIDGLLHAIDLAQDLLQRPGMLSRIDLRLKPGVPLERVLAALDLKGVWPRNALVHLQLAVSHNLQDWTPVPVKGPVYRFDGADPPVNTVLELEEPLGVEGRYLRITWPGHTGVKLASLTGQVELGRDPGIRPIGRHRPGGSPRGSCGS